MKLLWLWGLWQLVELVGGNRINYHGFKLVRFDRNDDFIRDVESKYDGNLRVSSNGDHIQMVDVVKHDSNHVYFVIAPEVLGDVKKLAHEYQIKDIVILNDNIQQSFITEKRKIIAQRREKRNQRRKRNSDGDVFDVQDFHSYDQIVNFLKRISEEFPNRAKLFYVTKTFEGRDLVGIKLSSDIKSNVTKPAIFIDAGIHAREWIAPAVAVYMIYTLTFDYGKNSTVTWLADEFDWYFIPVVNPDGYEYTRNKDRMWRKTRSRHAEVNKWCVGADANRNWGYKWGQTGANRSPCSNIYAGHSPFSEPEVEGLKEFIKNIPNVQVYTSFHSYGQVFLSPWGYTSTRPRNYQDQELAAKYAIDAIREYNGANYTFGSIAEVMYPASGTSIDYMQSLGIPFIYGIELKPSDVDQPDGFIVDTKIIKPSGEEMMLSLTKIAQYIKGELFRPPQFKRFRSRRQ